MPENPKPKPGPADLGGLGMLAENHLRRNQPNLLKSLERDGEVYEHLLAVEREAEAAFQAMLNRGVTPVEADRLVKQEHILLPDDDQDDEPEPPEML